MAMMPIDVVVIRIFYDDTTKPTLTTIKTFSYIVNKLFVEFIQNCDTPEDMLRQLKEFYWG
jgi:hypothetical protein